MTKVKKMLGMVMAALMCFALTPTAAFAASNDPGKITITPQQEGQTLAGHEYNVYQLVTGDVAKGTDNIVYLSNAEAGANLADKDTADVEEILNSVKKLEDSTLANVLWGYVNTASTPVAVLNEGNNWSANVPYGYYIVSDRYVGGEVTDGSDSISRYMVQVVGDVTVQAKSVFTTLDKIIKDVDVNAAVDADKKVDTAAIGDVIEYQLDSTVPNMEGYGSYTFIVTDTMSRGLTFNNDAKVSLGTSEVAVGDYAVNSEISEAGETTITINLNDLKALATKYNAVAGTAITITYSALVNANAEIGTTPNTNTATLEYSNNPQQSGNGTPENPNVTGKTPESTTYTYVTELTLTKVGKDTNATLAGAVFSLSGENLKDVVLRAVEKYVADPNGDWYLLKDGTYTNQTPQSNTASLYKSTTEKYVLTTVLTEANTPANFDGVIAEVNANGVLVFTGLHTGSYTLTEIQSPETYNKLAQPIEFEISPVWADTNLTTWNVTVTSNNAKISADSGVLAVTVENGKGLELPSTGGIGTMILYVIGGLLVLGAIVVLVRRRGSAK